MFKALKYTPIDFVVIEGLRSVTRQKKLVAQGASKTMNSRHLTGHAVDIVPIIDGVIRWDWPLYDVLAVAVKKAAKELDVMLVWGGDWVTFRDGPHFELDRKFYK
jgi:peptidoglycan L-alanyl-D-glutamate endopeptidase CwlK